MVMVILLFWLGIVFCCIGERVVGDVIIVNLVASSPLVENTSNPASATFGGLSGPVTLIG